MVNCKNAYKVCHFSWLKFPCHPLALCHFLVFLLMQTLSGFSDWPSIVLHRGHVSHVCGFGYVNVFMNLCKCVCERMKGRKTECWRERPTAAKARSPDIIEDGISDYPKDRNLSLSVIYFQLFYRPAFSQYVVLNSVRNLNKYWFHVAGWISL